MPRYWVTVHEVQCFDVAVEAENKGDAKTKAVIVIRSEKTPPPEYVSVNAINVLEAEISNAELQCFSTKKGYPKLSEEEKQEMEATNMSEPGG